MAEADMHAAASPTHDARIRRFSRTERLLHWVVAATFFAMLVTGAALYFPQVARHLDRPTAKSIHLWSAIVMGAGFVLLPLLGDRRGVWRSARQVQWSDADDLAWLRSGVGQQLGAKTAPPQGRFNAGQKLNSAITLGLLVVLAVTGISIWLGERNTSLRLSGAVPIHDLATIVVTLLVLGHIYLAMLNPATRHAMRGMITGDVDLAWAREHHATWAEEVEGAPVADGEPHVQQAVPFE